jgi:alpha-glucosidase
MAYSFDMLGPEFSARHFRSKIEGFFAGAPNGWPMWAFSNHDVPRHATRWQEHGTTDAVARQAAAMLLTFEGSVCLYQGEELGQVETDIEFHELTDPPGIRFWPEYKGRDGCRTPMTWDASATGGFTTGTPWLPVKAAQREHNVADQSVDDSSVLAHYRRMIAFRKSQPALISGKTRFVEVAEPVLAYIRQLGDDAVLVVLNLSPKPQALTIKGQAALIGPCLNAGLAADRLTLGPNAAAFLKLSGSKVSLIQ